MNAMGWMVEGCLRPKAIPLVHRDLVAYNRHDSCVIAVPFSLLTASWTDERRKVTERGSEGSQVDSKPHNPVSTVLP